MVQVTHVKHKLSVCVFVISNCELHLIFSLNASVFNHLIIFIHFFRGQCMFCTCFVFLFTFLFEHSSLTPHVMLILDFNIIISKNAKQIYWIIFVAINIFFFKTVHAAVQFNKIVTSFIIYITIFVFTN